MLHSLQSTHVWKWPVGQYKHIHVKPRICILFILCLTWTVNANSLKQNIIMIKEICSRLLPFCKQNLLLFIQPSRPPMLLLLILTRKVCVTYYKNWCTTPGKCVFFGFRSSSERHAGSVSGQPHGNWCWCHDIGYPLLNAEHSLCTAPWQDRIWVCGGPGQDHY